MSSNEFRIIPFYSYNDIAITGPSNLFIIQKINQPNEGTRRNWNCWWRILMLNLGQYPITKIPIPSMPTFKQYLTTISSKARSYSVYPSHPAQGFKDIWKITKEPRIIKDQTITKYQRFKKLSITKRRISKVHLEGVDKRCSGNQQRNIRKMLATSS